MRSPRWRARTACAVVRAADGARRAASPSKTERGNGTSGRAQRGRCATGDPERPLRRRATKPPRPEPARRRAGARAGRRRKRLARRSVYASTWIAIAPNQTMKLALCSPSTSAPVRDCEERDAGAEQRRASRGRAQARRAAASAGAAGRPARSRAAGVVAGEPVAGRRELQRDRREQQHADEHVHREQLPDRGDRRPSTASSTSRTATDERQ